MVTSKRKNDFQYGDPIWRTSDEGRGCDAYFSGAIQYPLRGGSDALTKLLIAAAVNLVPVIGSIIFGGYALRAARRVLEGDYELPEWDDFAGDFVNGLIFAIGMFVFGLLTMLSLVLVVTIPIAILFAFPLYGFVVSRYAATGDFASFFDIVGAYRSVFVNFGEAVTMTLASLAMVIVFAVLIGVGTVFFIVPGLMAAAALSLAVAHNAGTFGRAAMAY